MKKRFREFGGGEEETGQVPGWGGGEEEPQDEPEPAAQHQQQQQQPSTFLSRLMAKSQKVEEDEGEPNKTFAPCLFAHTQFFFPLSQTTTRWRR